MFPLVPVEPSAHLGRHVRQVEGFVTHCLIPAQARRYTQSLFILFLKYGTLLTRVHDIRKSLYI